jgi:hypothetical protein
LEQMLKIVTTLSSYLFLNTILTFYDFFLMDSDEGYILSRYITSKKIEYFSFRNPIRLDHPHKPPTYVFSLF